jgi:hypothetical protein
MFYTFLTIWVNMKSSQTKAAASGSFEALGPAAYKKPGK